MSRPYLSGFCNPSNPADSHARCGAHPRTDGVPCTCTCHSATAEPAPTPAPPEPVNIGVEGFHPDIDEEAYHADPGSLSQSGAKVLLKAPALFQHQRLNPQPFKKAFEFGTAAHAKVLGVGAEIRVIPDDLLGKNGAASTTEAKAFIAKARADGAVPLKSAEAQRVDDMAEQLTAHSLAMELLSEGAPEVSAYATDEQTGVLRRCRFDWLGPEILSDYKALASSDPAAFARAAFDLGYYQQAPWYLDLARDLGHPAAGFAFIVQMKEPPFLVTVIELKPRAIDRGRERNREALDLYRHCVDTDTWPGYVPDHSSAAVDLPPFAYTNNEVEISA